MSGSTEEPIEGDGDVSEPKQETVSPKVTRPKLPKFSSHTLGHHYRNKTDPGQAADIKNLMEEIKKWKEGSIFDKSPIRAKVVKPQTIPRAHSTHTSPRSSPPPGSPNVGKRSSSLNRNRSRSLKLLTDKLKSGRGGSGQTSPNLQVPKTLNLQLNKEPLKGRETDSGDESPMFPERMMSPSMDSASEDECKSSISGDLETGKKLTVEPIPENDEREDEDEKADVTSTSSGDTAGTPDKPKPKSELKMRDSFKDSIRAADDDGSGSADSDTPTTHISTLTLHPVDRNSTNEFLRLRQTAPSKRRPGYAGLSLPKTKIPSFFKSHSDEGEEVGVKKPNKLDLSGGTRKVSAGARFPSQYKGDGTLESTGYIWFSSPSTESLPPLPGEGECSANVGSISSLEGQAVSRGDEDSDYGSPVPKDDNVITEEKCAKSVESEGEKAEKRNGKSPKQKSKSDPSGNKSFDFNVAGAIMSSQSQSFPLLQREETTDMSQSGASVNDDKEADTGIEQGTGYTGNTEPPGLTQAVSTDSDLLNNNNEELEDTDSITDLPSGKFNDRIRSVSESEGKSTSNSITDENMFSPSSEMSEPFEDAMSQSGGGIEDFKSLESSDISQTDERGDTEMEGTGALSISMPSNMSDNSHPSTPISHSPTGTLEKQSHLLSVPSPKRPILRSVSSASVLQRERKYSGGNLKDTHKDAPRKHSLTTHDDTASPNEAKSMEFLPIGDGGSSPLASSMPSVWNVERLPSVSPDRETPYVKDKDKRYHIVEELYRNEREYVEALKMLKERYMDPLKTVSGIDERVIDNIFYMIPEILMHHQIYLEFLNQEWTRWSTDTSTVGDIILKMFSGQSVQDSYLSFVENYKTSGKVIENAIQTKSSVQKFVEQCQKESGSKLTMKDLIVRPIQRIPRVELLIQRLLVNTPGDHPDYALLKEAEKTLHKFAKKIGHLSKPEELDGQQETLKKLEMLLMTDLAVQDRHYLRHDMVQILNKKDQCCIWMFSDLIIISSVRRRSGPVTRKVSIILKSPTGQDFAENIKQKIWLRVGLDDIEIVKNQGSLKRGSTLDKEQVEEDLDILDQIQDLSNKLNCNHMGLDEVVREMDMSLKKQLEEHNLRTSLLDTAKMELLVTTQEGVLNLEVNLSSGEKRANWETTFLDAKQKLSLLSDKRAPDFLQALPITKTRAGMQFSCASPIDGYNNTGHRDVWVCNSDGYVGHMCLLSLQPEPIVTLNTPVPGCNARILCIGAVPAHANPRRKSSAKHTFKGPPSPGTDGPRISIEEVDSAITEEDVGPQGDGEIPDTVSEEGYQSESESSDESDEEIISTQKLFVEDFDVKQSQYSTIAQSTPDSFTTSGSWTQNPHKSTMWLGTEDGCIHIFQCTDNIKTTKNKLKIQLGYPVFCIIYLDNKVFVSLSNGDLLVYRRDSDGIWDTENPYTRAIGSVTAPIVKMLPVAGKLWCGRQNNICVINPLTLNIETTFPVHSDSNRCVQCIVSAGQGVWIASQQTYKVVLYHATTFEFLMEVSIAQAVNLKLQSADDIIRQHKAACLRITSLLVCKDLLWVGTSAGVILTLPMPKITSTTTKGFLTVPNVTGLVFGHTGHVRFLTCVELSNTNVPPLLQGMATQGSDAANNNTNNNKDNSDPPAPHELHARRSSVATMTQTLATRMLVISGGDGYEDFRNNVAQETAGKDDSTNHLLLWQV